MSQRYYSLDVFRGVTVALMILVNNPGTWSYMFSPLKHAPWHGVTPTDLVFPFFLFAVGNAMAFVMPRLQAAGSKVFWTKVIKRTVLIFLIGLFLNWWPFVQWRGEDLIFKAWVDADNPERGIRLLGVLQRIALAYFFASIIVFYLRIKAIVWVSALILLIYWVLCHVLGQGDPYSLAGWFGTAIDQQILGVAHMYKGEGVPFEPEGLVSTLPSVVQVVFGFLVGYYIKSKGESNSPSLYQMLSGLFVLGVLIASAGLAWGLVFPLNKKIWTSSYVLYTTGLAMLTIGVMIWYLEGLRVKNGFTRFFDVFGKNPLFIFVLSGLLPRILALVRWQVDVSADGTPVYTSPLRWFYIEICTRLPGPPEVGSFFYALCFLVLFWFFAYLLDKNKIYIKV